jgi:hypothetical protein
MGGVAGIEGVTLDLPLEGGGVGWPMFSTEVRRRATLRAAFSFSDRKRRVASSR